MLTGFGGYCLFWCCLFLAWSVELVFALFLARYVVHLLVIRVVVCMRVLDCFFLCEFCFFPQLYLLFV